MTTPPDSPKHTRGPWEALPIDGESFGVYVARDTNGDRLATVARGQFYDRPMAEVGANARLISAAPALLDACKQALGMLDVTEWDGAPGYESIKAAVAKAEGGAS